MKQIVFVCGVNGVGKSSVIPFLASLLSRQEYAIHDFDERGVPEHAGNAWRASETEYWLETAKHTLQETGQITVICGFVKPMDFGARITDVGSRIQCIFLDANPDTIRARLTKRYTKDGVFDPEQKVIGKTIQAFIEGNVWIRDQLKAEFETLGCAIVDTSHLTPEEVANRVVERIRKQ